jgi:4-amino-4-deoxy-L-arabinose transferase-like glycosyltransferase
MFKVLKQHKVLFLIFLLAFFLRVWQLGTFPDGFHIDEVKVGWNAYSILKTGLDDRGNKLALYYNSFGDFRPTGIFYITIPSIIVFGLNEFAVRFPSAILGALTVFPLYFLVLEILKSKKPISGYQQPIALFATFLLAISPWHISVSRATSEVVISMFFALCGLYFLIRGIREIEEIGKKKKIILFTTSFLLITASYLFYHSIRILAPMFVGATIFYFWKIQKIKLDKWVLLVLAGLILLTGILSLNKEARGRFSQVSIFNDLTVQYELSKMPFEEGNNNVFTARLFHNKVTVYTRRFLNEYGKYFSADFFLNPEGAKPARYTTVGVGLLTYVELALLVAGLIATFQKKFSILPLLLLLLSPIAAALTTEDSPNLHRALFMLPFLVIIEAYGIYTIQEYSRKIPILLATCYLLLILNFIFFLHMYFVHNKVHLPLYRNVGAKEMALYLNEVKGGYDKIILTNIPDDPYPWIAFFTGQDPAMFNQSAIKRDQGTWTFENFVFSAQRCPSRDAFTKPDVKKLLVVDAEGCATESNLKQRSDVTLIKRILRPDESEVYNIWSRIEK